MGNYRKYLRTSLKELERDFFRGEADPQQENDVTCYLFHSLVKRGILPKRIWTERTYDNIGRVDLNLDDRLLVEIRLLSRKTTYGDKSWKNYKNTITGLADKLNKCYNNTSRCHKRQPVIILWNWRGEISDDLNDKLILLGNELRRRW